MTTIKQHSLWQALSDANIVQGDAPANNTLNSPWYVKSLLAISGWLGALFILAFIVAISSFLLAEPTVCFVISLLLCASAYGVLNTPKNEFFEHLALAFSLAGQALFCWALFSEKFDNTSWVILGVLQAFLAYVMPSFLHRFFSTAFAISAFEVALITQGQPYILGSLIIFPTVWLCLREFIFVNHYKRINGILYGLVIAMLALNSQQFLNEDLFELFTLNHEALIIIPPWLIQGLFVSTALFTSQQLLQQYQVRLNSKLSLTIIILTLTFAIITLKAPGILAGLIIVLLGFSQSNRVLLGLGVLSLVFYCSSYYYFMEETLLFKAGLLFIFGVIALLCRLVLIKAAPQLKLANSSHNNISEKSYRDSSVKEDT